MSHGSIKSTARRYLTVSAHFYSGLVLHQGSWPELQVGYQISMGRPRLKRNHRQEGFPPSWLRLTQSEGVNAKLTTGAYGMRSQVCMGTQHRSQAHCWAPEGESRDACVQNGAFRARSRRGPPLTFLSRVSCRGRLIAPT